MWIAYHIEHSTRLCVHLKTYRDRNKGMSDQAGQKQGQGLVYGDVIVNSNTHPDIILGNVLDPKRYLCFICNENCSRTRIEE